ncbi:MAG TPA: sulfatase/phosphatase domain-containing protein [Terriglobia bacterium]|nr:sulfatase/phosphatase domain-containing protein [Terriglobia bacterium]
MKNENDKRSRREFLKTGAEVVGAAALGAGPLPLLGGTPLDPPRPNFIFVTTDGHRPVALSLNGNEIVKTPNFDRIGREGIQFRNSFVVNALCLPSRATALTGLYSHNTGCVDNKNRAIPQDVPLFTDLLRTAGYELGLFGKAHVRGLGERYWDYYFGFPGAATDYFWPVIQEGSQGKLEKPKVHEGYVDDVVTDRAVEWLKQKRDKSFCLILWIQSPHAPFFRARRYLDLYNGVTIPKPNTFDDDLKGYPGKPRAFADADDSIGTYVKHSQTKGNCARSLEELTKDYYAGIVGADDNFGKIFQALSDLGQLDDTAILFSSDHGFFLGEWRKYDKRFMHEPSIRAPMLIRYPRMIRAGSVADPMVLNLDIAPTFLDLAGVKVPEWMQGRSMVPFLKGEVPENWRKDWLYEYYEYPGPHNVRKNRGVRTERYKLIHYYEAPEEFELYDLQEDPGELQNLYGDPRYSALARQLRQRIDELRKETGDHYIYEEPSPVERPGSARGPQS